MGTSTESVPTLIRNSERSTFKRCRQMWYWNFVDRLKPLDVATPLRFGDLIHQSLAAYYKRGTKRGPKPWLTFEKLYSGQIEEMGRMSMTPEDEEKWIDAGELGEAMLKGYVDTYGERDKEFRILSSEQTFQLPITVPELVHEGALILPSFEIVVVGTLDGVWEHIDGSKGPFFKEFKTAKAIDVSALSMDEQAGTYWTFAPKWLWRNKMLAKGVYPTHIEYTFLRKALPDLRPENEDGHKLNKPSKDVLLSWFGERNKVPKSKLVDDMIREIGDEAWLLGEISKKQPSPLFVTVPVYRDAEDRQAQYERVCAEAREMWMTRMGILDPIKNPGPLYNPNCRGCSFLGMCELHETGNDWEGFRDGTMGHWDPYAAHEIVERW